MLQERCQPEFQFTHPVRGATEMSLHRSPVRHEFQFTHPVRGATCLNSRLTLISQCFNSRTPCGVRQGTYLITTTSKQFQFTHPVRGATNLYLVNTLHLLVSIHAPRAGCDRTSSLDISGVSVSIHAPRAGCDTKTSTYNSNGLLFQFTHPVRGATPHPTALLIQPKGFNSRTPCGVRLGWFSFLI